MLRIILLILVVFLIARIFVIMGSSGPAANSQSGHTGNKDAGKKGVPRELGEYVEFEEVKKTESQP